MLKSLLPYSQIDTSNPIFQRDLRRLRWLRSPEAIHRYSRIVTFGISLLALGWWILERAAYGFGAIPATVSARFPTILLLSAILLTLPSSFYAVISCIILMHRFFETDEWSLLRITAQSEHTILAIKNATAQIHALRIVIFEVGIRLAIVLIIILNLLYDQWQITDDKSTFLASFLNPLSCYFFAAIIGAGFLISIEPLLRIRMMTALCSAISVRTRASTLALLAGFLIVPLILMPQILAFGIFWSWMNAGLQGEEGLGIILCILPVSGFTLPTLLGLSYHLLRKVSLPVTYRASVER